MENEQNRKDMVLYIEKLLEEKAVILRCAVSNITKKWNEHNINNVFEVKTNCIYYNGKYRMKVLVQSFVGDNNIIFYSRQDSMSGSMEKYAGEINNVVQDFILSVMGDFIEQGMESKRREVLLNNRFNMGMVDGKPTNAEVMIRPLTHDEGYALDKTNNA